MCISIPPLRAIFERNIQRKIFGNTNYKINIIKKSLKIARKDFCKRDALNVFFIWTASLKKKFFFSKSKPSWNQIVWVLKILCLETFCQGSGVSLSAKENHILPHTHRKKKKKRITPLFYSEPKLSSGRKRLEFIYHVHFYGYRDNWIDSIQPSLLSHFNWKASRVLESGSWPETKGY